MRDGVCFHTVVTEETIFIVNFIGFRVDVLDKKEVRRTVASTWGINVSGADTT